MFEEDKCFLGIELGSTRIKAVLISAEDYAPVASGSYTWKDSYVDGYWSYSLDDVWKGLQTCYGNLKKDVKEKYGITLKNVAALGVSAMMHGYLAFDKDGRELVPFRTWRNTTTAESAQKLTSLFSFNIPQRWSVAHLYQAMLNGEEHVKDLRYLTTLSGYVHYCLTGENVLGIGDASGMFPIDSKILDYDRNMAERFKALTDFDILAVLPKILVAGEDAGVLTEKGAKLLDVDGDLLPGIPLAPPEGDAGTGMAATNAVRERTGNVSAGTSIFSMVVLENMLKNVYSEIDMVTTPDGKPVAMVHCNNCTSDMNSWVSLLHEAVVLMGGNEDLDELYARLYKKSLDGDLSGDGVTIYNFISGEPVVGVDDGRPIVVRDPAKAFNLATFIKAHLYSSLASLSHGMDILINEGVKVDRLMGHGGIFRHPPVGEKYLSSAVNAPVSVMRTAGEGGPYGMALLAAYLINGKGESLAAFLDSVFASAEMVSVEPVKEEVEGFKIYLDRFLAGLDVEKTAIEKL